MFDIHEKAKSAWPPEELVPGYAYAPILHAGQGVAVPEQAAACMANTGLRISIDALGAAAGTPRAPT